MQLNILNDKFTYLYSIVFKVEGSAGVCRAGRLSASFDLADRRTTSCGAMIIM